MTAYINGAGSFVPERAVGNEELGARLGLDPEQIFKSSGIRRRRWAAAGTPTSELAARALAAALDDAGLAASELDYLLCGTMTPDRFVPGMAPAVATRAGLGPVPCLDIRATCCNALYGLQLAAALVEAGAARRVGICLAEIQSAWLELTAEAGTTSMLFGDGASALVVSGEPRPGAWEVCDVLLAADGSFADDLGVRCPGTEFGVRLEDGGASRPAPEDFFPRMAGQSVILHASRKMAAACRELLERRGLTVEGVRWVVPHQANANLLAQVARALRFQTDGGGLVSILEEYGNTSSASMGMAADALRRGGRARGGDYVLLPAFGAGFTWGAGLCRVVADS